MQVRRIGRLDVSVVGVGCNNFGGRIDTDRSVRVVHAALDEGINFFDTADIYGGGGGSEEALGRALAGRRDEAIVATKFGGRMPDGGAGGRPEYVRQACDASLERLGVDHIDLYQQHFPDDETPVAETLGAMSALVDAGKVVHIGCSNYGAERLHRALRSASDRGLQPPVSVQNELSLLSEADDHAELIAHMEQSGVMFLPYYPLASGLLTGKYTRAAEPPPGTRLAGSERTRARWMTDTNIDAAERLGAWAAEHGHTLLELAFSWLAAQPRVASVIAGATSPEQVAQNAAAVEWKLSADDLDEIAALRPAGAR
jgi:aryl-alcohol dehydrogenase-like predicted oxidoreductase